MKARRSAAVALEFSSMIRKARAHGAQAPAQTVASCAGVLPR